MSTRKTPPRRMLLNAFSMNCVSHIQQGLWVRDDTRQLEFGSLDPWVDLARLLELDKLVRFRVVTKH